MRRFNRLCLHYNLLILYTPLLAVGRPILLLHRLPDHLPAQLRRGIRAHCQTLSDLVAVPSAIGKVPRRRLLEHKLRPAGFSPPFRDLYAVLLYELGSHVVDGGALRVC
ncbi:hypothetical protein CABS02_13684 [Colletotrichum abscissum]|uniref:Uncharacterized protein n=1 Tax=Colletotrichum abscissum TaxID=1671311 RepID=A0A9P9X2F3_9PEZI|nr:hypothetical protein CABS02_13684 [Colletotrichum abscissum]